MPYNSSIILPYFSSVVKNTPLMHFLNVTFLPPSPDSLNCFSSFCLSDIIEEMIKNEIDRMLAYVL